MRSVTGRSRRNRNEGVGKESGVGGGNELFFAVYFGRDAAVLRVAIAAGACGTGGFGGFDVIGAAVAGGPVTSQAVDISCFGRADRAQLREYVLLCAAMEGSSVRAGKFHSLRGCKPVEQGYAVAFGGDVRCGIFCGVCAGAAVEEGRQWIRPEKRVAGLVHFWGVGGFVVGDLKAQKIVNGGDGFGVFGADDDLCASRRWL